MSYEILDQDLTPQVDPAPRVAMTLKRQTQETYRHLAAVFNFGAKQFWANADATPAEIAEALGTDGAAVFQLHSLLGQLMAQVRPEAIAAGMSVVGEFEYNEDGTITVN